MNSYRFEGLFKLDFPSDKEAFEEACGWHDERDAFVEKWIDGMWCPHTNPIYHAWAYYGGKNGGWLDMKDNVIPSED